MANNFKISNAVAILACDALVDSIDAGAGAGTIQIRSGSQPADPDTAASGTLLATLTFSDPAFGAAADAAPGATATASAITADSSADATGTAGYFRVLDSDSNVICDGEIGTSGADLNLNTTSITSGDNVAISSFTITIPES